MSDEELLKYEAQFLGTYEDFRMVSISPMRMALCWMRPDGNRRAM